MDASVVINKTDAQRYIDKYDNVAHMKVSLWLFTLALAIVCAGTWAISHLLIRLWQPNFGGLPIPEFTRLILLPSGWILFCPVPWGISAAFLTFRGQVTPNKAFIFAGTVCVAMAAIVASVSVAVLIYYVQLRAY
jgi:hypothetical protein